MFKITIEKYATNIDDSAYDKSAVVLKTFMLETKKEANSQKRKLIKEFDMVKLGHTHVNYSKQIEIVSNY